MLKTVVFAIFLFVTTSAGAIEPVYSSWNKAIKGYDPVAYFTKGEAVKGDKQHIIEWNGAKWYFSSADNAKLFKVQPEKYAPQYGGYCAYAVSQGGTAKIDPTAWAIEEGKLYLNYSKGIQSTWDENRAVYIKSADKNWPIILKE